MPGPSKVIGIPYLTYEGSHIRQVAYLFELLWLVSGTYLQGTWMNKGKKKSWSPGGLQPLHDVSF